MIGTIMGARWRTAVVLTMAIAIIALVILVADDEHASHYEEIVKLHQSIKRSVHNWKSLWHNGKDGQETIQRRGIPGVVASERSQCIGCACELLQL